MKILALSFLLSCCASQDKNLTEHQTDLQVEKWDVIMENIKSNNPLAVPTLMQAHLVNKKNELLLCDEAGKLNVPMGFMTHQDRNLHDRAYKIAIQNVGIMGFDWQEFGQFNATAQVPTVDGFQSEKLNVRLYVSSEFIGKVAPDVSLYTDCAWYSVDAIPADDELSNLSLDRKQLQKLLRITKARKNKNK